MGLAVDAPDRQLIREGDLAALVRRYYGPVIGLTRRLLGDPAEARDAAQETFARALARLRTYDPERPFRVWIFAIAANLVRDLLRRRRPGPMGADLEDSLADLSLPELPALRAEDRGRILAAVDRLSPDLRLVVALHFQQDLPPVEIAEILDISPNAARLRLYRALHALRKDLS
jgi:RNA polymerase sigma-70 factor (ECF subfamily)